MSYSGRRSSLLNIDTWLDKCSNDEPDSMIYEPDYTIEVATVRSKQKEPELTALYRDVTDVCTKIGLPQDLVEERLGDIDECLTSYITQLQKDVQDEFETLCKYRQDLLDKIAKMMNDLHLPAYIPEDNITLLQHCKRLKTKFKELDSVRHKRLVRLQQLREKQVTHCSILGIEAPQVKTQTDIPSEEELIKLSNVVLELEKEEKRRKEKYLLVKEMISNCMHQLEYEPITDFESNILTEVPKYTESHLRDMTNLHTRLEALHEKNQEKFKNLKDRLISLYDRLDVGQGERAAFLETHNTGKPSLMVEMEVEIERYEELKRQNIGKFINKIKDELVVEYEKCYISQDQQDNFFALSNVSGECNEELLDLYERELERIKKYYEDNKEMLEKFQKWRMMWKELIDLEVKANDPNRFNNRGGQLLLEEKKRKALQKGLPKVEKELLALNDKYSKSTDGNKFKIFDTNLDEFIAGCWDELNSAKEEEKKERQRAKMGDSAISKGRKPLAGQVMAKKTPTKRAAGAGITPTPSKLHCQRSILGTPANNTYRSNQQLGMSGSVKKSIQKTNRPQPTVQTRAYQHSSEKSQIPVFNAGHASQKDKTTRSNGSDFSAVSLSEQEFEDMIVTCPASAKRTR